MYVMDQHKCWEELFQVNLWVTMSDAFSWDQLEDRVLVGPEDIQEMEEKMQTIRQSIKEVQDRQKSYADAH